MCKYLIFDWGGTSVKYACGDEFGHICSINKFPTPKSDLEELLYNMKKIYESYGAKEKISGLAISSPGAVNSEAGVIGGISAIPYIHQIPIAKIISRYFDDVAVTIQNDANCAALGELWKGAAKGKKNVVVVVCGTGIGGGIIINQKIYTGTTHNGGEFGNFLIQKNGGDYGTWSSYTLVKQCELYREKTGVHVDGKELLELERTGDILAKHLIGEFYEVMAAGCYQIQFALDPELILLGGGVSDVESLVNEIEKQFDTLEQYNEIGFLRPQLSVCRFGSQANLYGALYHHLCHLREEKGEIYEPYI